MFQSYAMDKFSLLEKRLWEKRHTAREAYYWDNYCHFARQRSLIYEDLKKSLAVNCSPFTFSKWQRVVDYKYSLEPLSAKGSLLNDPGGRFNIGDIDQSRFPRFAALYLAEDRDTAYKEKFGLTGNKDRSGLTEEELALTSGSSIVIVSVKGEVNQVIDLCNSSVLKPFYELIKNIKLPKSFTKRARALNIDPLEHIKTQNELLKNLLISDWRTGPMVYDIPCSSQIFGQIANAAGIEGILYPSRVTKKKCRAVFPQNLYQSVSYVEIEGESPSQVKYKCLNAATYQMAI